MKKTAIVILSLIVTNVLCAQESKNVYNFMRLPVSAHAAAVGGDNISLIEDDETLIFHNPALLASVSDKNINLNYLHYILDANMISAAFNKTINNQASTAISAQYINYGTMKQTSAENIVLGEFSAKDIAIAGYFSYMLSNCWMGGISTKMITSYIGGYNSLAMGVDIGLNYYNPQSELSVSLVAKNLGGQLKAYNEEYESMPADVQVGFSKHLVHTPFRFHVTAVDLNHWNYKFINHLVSGIDLSLSKQIWVGIGYNFRRAHEMSIRSGEVESSHSAGFSCGAGINLQRIKFNLAYGKYHLSSSALLINASFEL